MFKWKDNQLNYCDNFESHSFFLKVQAAVLTCPFVVVLIVFAGVPIETNTFKTQYCGVVGQSNVFVFCSLDIFPSRWS